MGRYDRGKEEEHEKDRGRERCRDKGEGWRSGEGHTILSLAIIIRIL